MFCQGFSEPGAGSDLGSLTTWAARRGDSFVVTGHKIWTSSAQLADWIYLAVRTDRDAKHRGHLGSRLPVDTPGIEVRTFPTLGGGVLCETFLDGVEIPAANLVGELNGGWDVLMYTLDFERVTAEKLGGLAWVLDAVEERLARRIGSTARRSPRLARLRGELQAARLLSFRAADMLDRGLPGSATSAMAKLVGCTAGAARSATPQSTCSGSRASATLLPTRPCRAAPRRCTAPRSDPRSPAARPRCSSS